MWFFLMACNTPPPPAVPAPTPEPPPVVEAPPPPVPRSAIGPVEPGVRKIFAKAERLKPEQYSPLMAAVAEIGPSSLPSLLGLIDETDDKGRLFALCDAVAQFDLRDAAVADVVLPKLVGADEVAVASCGGAVAHTLPIASDKTEQVSTLITGANACWVRKSIAAEARIPSLCKTYKLDLDLGDECRGTIAAAGLQHCDKGADLLIRTAGDDSKPTAVREGALASLRGQGEKQAAAVCREWLRRGVYNNGMTFALEILGEVGNTSDTGLIETVIKADPNGRGSAHSRAAFQALEALSSR